jgi:hypothetical protein
MLTTGMSALECTVICCNFKKKVLVETRTVNLDNRFPRRTTKPYTFTLKLILEYLKNKIRARIFKPDYLEISFFKCGRIWSDRPTDFGGGVPLLTLQVLKSVENNAMDCCFSVEREKLVETSMENYAMDCCFLECCFHQDGAPYCIEVNSFGGCSYASGSLLFLGRRTMRHS